MILVWVYVATYEVDQPLHGHLMRPDAFAAVKFVTHGNLSIYICMFDLVHTLLINIKRNIYVYIYKWCEL